MSSSDGHMKMLVCVEGFCWQFKTSQFVINLTACILSTTLTTVFHIMLLSVVCISPHCPVTLSSCVLNRRTPQHYIHHTSPPSVLNALPLWNLISCKALQRFHSGESISDSRQSRFKPRMCTYCTDFEPLIGNGVSSSSAVFLHQSGGQHSLVLWPHHSWANKPSTSSKVLPLVSGRKTARNITPTNAKQAYSQNVPGTDWTFTDYIRLTAYYFEDNFVHKGR